MRQSFIGGEANAAVCVLGGKKKLSQSGKSQRSKGTHRMAHSPQALTTHQGRKQVNLVFRRSPCQRCGHSMTRSALDQHRLPAAPGHLEPFAAIFPVCSQDRFGEVEVYMQNQTAKRKSPAVRITLGNHVGGLYFKDLRVEYSQFFHQE